MGIGAERIYFNPWDEAFRANPYPYYANLVQGPPRLVDTYLPIALVARYADVVAVLRDHERFSSVPSHSPVMKRAFGSVRHVVFSDPPEHGQLRHSVSHAFAPLRIHGAEAKMREFTKCCSIKSRPQAGRRRGTRPGRTVTGDVEFACSRHPPGTLCVDKIIAGMATVFFDRPRTKRPQWRGHARCFRGAPESRRADRVSWK